MTVHFSISYITGQAAKPTMASPRTRAPGRPSIPVALAIKAVASLLFVGLVLWKEFRPDVDYLHPAAQTAATSDGDGFHSIHVYYGPEDAVKGLRSSSSEMQQNYNAGSQVDQDKAAAGYVRPNKLFGYVHIGKAGGTNLNSLFANVFERVCGNKGYSFESYKENEVAKHLGNGYPVESFNEAEPVRFEDCDYVANEVNYKFWIQNFGNESFHGVPMELHVPCRDRIDHVMSQCNYWRYSLDCAITSDEDFFRTIEEECFTFVHQRYQHELKDHFDVKCFDVKKQFTTYARHMSQYLERKRFQSVPFIPRLSNRPRNRTKECIWSRPDLREKLEKYLLENVPYYQFCEDCMGSDNDLTSSTKGGTRKGRIGEEKAGEEESIFTWKKEGLGEAPTSKLYNLYWNQLPAEAKEKAELLGYSEKTWNSDADIPIYDHMLNLSPEEMEAMQYLGVFIND